MKNYHNVISEGKYYSQNDTHRKKSRQILLGNSGNFDRENQESNLRFKAVNI